MLSSETDLARVIEVAGHGLFEYCPADANLHLNQTAKRHFGLSPEAELDWSGFLATLHPDDREQVESGLMKALQGEKAGKFQIEFRAIGIEDGTERWLTAAGRAFFDSRGKPIRCMALTEEITERKRADGALRDSGRIYRTIGELIPYGIWITDPEGGVVYLSQSFLDMVGMTLEEVKEFGWLDRYPPEKIPTFMADWKRTLEEGSFWNYEHPIRDKHDVYQTILSRGVPFRDGEGRITSWVGINLDITELKQAQEEARKAREDLQRQVEERTRALRQSENLLRNREATLRLAIETTGLGTFDYYPSTGELYWSDLAKLHFGLPPDAEVNYDIFLSGLHPGDRERVHDIVQKVLRPGSQGRYNIEYRTIGIQDHQERWLSAQGRVFFDSAGQPVRFLGATVDITERKRAEEALRKALAEAEEGRRILEAMMEHIPMGITIAEAPDVRIRVVSRYGRELTGRLREQIEDIPVDLHVERWDIYRADGVTRAVNEELPLTRATRQGETVKEEEWVLKNPAGTRIPILCTAAPIRDGEGRITGGVIGWQDISSRKRAEEERERLIAELIRSNLELEQFAYVASHDLQEPLRMVGNYVQLLERKYRNQLDEKASQYIDFAVEGAVRMQHLVEGLLAYSRIGRSEERFEEVALEEAYSLAVAHLAGAIEESRAEVTREDLPAVFGNKSQLVQLLQNLISNGIKYRRPDTPPRVHVSALREKQEWIVAVRDNGIGIEPQYFDRIF